MTSSPGELLGGRGGREEADPESSSIAVVAAIDFLAGLGGGSLLVSKISNPSTCSFVCRIFGVDFVA